jgi:hypothetical protein
MTRGGTRVSSSLGDRSELQVCCVCFVWRVWVGESGWMGGLAGMVFSVRGVRARKLFIP